MASVFKVTRSGYYAYLKRGESEKSKKDKNLLKKIKKSHEESKGRYGSPSIHGVLKNLGINVGRKRIARIMRENDIKSVRIKFLRKKIQKKELVFANKLARNFFAKEPNTKWVSDITEIKTNKGKLYIAAILDLFSRKIIGLAMDVHMKTDLVLRALTQALYRRKPLKPVLYHSDQGAQYTSQKFQRQLKMLDFDVSMSHVGACFDNAVMESFFASLKTECVYLNKYKSIEDAKCDIFEYVELWYNKKRKHSYLNYMSPEEFEKNNRFD
jgi:transposase InsO family protein